MLEGLFGGDALVRVVDEDLLQEVEEQLVEIGVVGVCNGDDFLEWVSLE